jgi:hypothetical protein
MNGPELDAGAKCTEALEQLPTAAFVIVPDVRPGDFLRTGVGERESHANRPAGGRGQDPVTEHREA